MVKTSLIALALGLIASAAMAQTPGGATGATPTRDVGTGSNQTGSGATESSSMLEQRIKQESAAGASSSHYNTFTPDNGYQAQAQTSDRMYRGHYVAITDEYGFRYDAKGQRIQ